MNRNKRVLTVALAGYIDERGKFTGGTKELPLIGNEAYIVTREKIKRVHNLTQDDGSPSIVIAEHRRARFRYRVSGRWIV